MKALKNIAGKQDSGFEHFLLFSCFFFLFLIFGSDCKTYAIFHMVPLDFHFYLKKKVL